MRSGTVDAGVSSSRHPRMIGAWLSFNVTHLPQRGRVFDSPWNVFPWGPVEGMQAQGNTPKSSEVLIARIKGRATEISFGL